MWPPRNTNSDIPISIRPETILYHAGDVWITTTRLVIGDSTYWLPDIHSLDVSSVSKPPILLRALYFVPVPLIFALIWIQGENATWFGQMLRVVAFVALAAVAVFAAFVFSRRGDSLDEPTRYLIRLNGKNVIYTSRDGDYALWLARQVAGAKEGKAVAEGYYPASPEIGQGEYVYYSDGVAAITSKQVILGKEHLPLAAIKKGHVSQSQPVKYTQRWSLALALMALNSMLNIIRQGSPDSGRDFYFLWPGDFAILHGLVHLAILGAMVSAFMELNSTSHTVRLRGSFNGAEWVEPFATQNQAYAKELVATINRAISAHKTGVYTGNATMPS